MRLIDIRLAVRLQRFEILGFGLFIAVLAVAAVVLAGQLDATGYGAHCSREGTNDPACEVMGRAFYGLQQTQVPIVQMLLLALPYLLAGLIGAPLIAREIERGTTRLAWALAPSRVHWFVVRVLPPLVIVLGLAIVAGTALERLLAALEPDTDMANAFAGFGDRGIVLVGRVIFVLAVGVVVGTAMGRVLPAVILTAVIAYVSLLGGSYVHDRVLASQAVLLQSGPGSHGDYVIDQRVRLADGRVITWDEAYRLNPPTENNPDPLPPGAAVVNLAVPGSRYLEVALREVGVLLGGSAMALALAAGIANRRRPD